MTVLAGALLADGRRADLRIAAGRITAITPVGTPAPPGEQRVDLAGALLTPAFVDGHIHLDKTQIGLPFQPHIPTANLAGRIEVERGKRRAGGVTVETCGLALVRQASGFGTTAMRSHVDIDPETRLDGLHALLRLRETVRDIMDLQIVAFPQSGLTSQPGVDALLDQAIAEGADLVGGLDPAGIDGDVTGHLDTVFAIAARRGVGVDIHLHDPGMLGCFELRQIAARTAANGLHGRVAVSHAFALGDVPPAEFARTAEALAAADIAIMTHGPGAGPMPPVLALAAAGVRVFAGSDNIRDAWSPFGNGDMLERAMLIAYRQGYRADADLASAFDLATTAPARVLGLGCPGLSVGAPADLVALPASCLAEAVASRPTPRWVMKAGKILTPRGDGQG